MTRNVYPVHTRRTPSKYAVVIGLVFISASLLASASVRAAESATGAHSSRIERIEKNLRDLGGAAVDRAADISSLALSLIGVDYKFGGNTPDQGLDCSGFVRYVFQQATGINLPRTSREQAKIGEAIEKDALLPGDLVFFNTRRFQFSHVGLYLGDNRFVHSPSRGGSVEIVTLDNSYWKKVFNGARRVLGSVYDKPVTAKAPTKARKVNSSEVLAITSDAPAVVSASVGSPRDETLNLVPTSVIFPLSPADK